MLELAVVISKASCSECVLPTGQSCTLLPGDAVALLPVDNTTWFELRKADPPAARSDERESEPGSKR